MSTRTCSIKKQVYEEWVKNPYARAVKICEICHFDYKQHGNYVNFLLSQFRSYTDLGLPQEPQRLEHRTFEWDGISRELLPGLGELDRRLKFWGWKVALGNNNDMWVFKADFGSVHWYKEGLVLLYLKGELQLAKVKTLFCKAFSFIEQDKAFFEKYLDVPLREVYRKWIFDMGKPVPKFDIRTFERSHGLRIFTDLSHPQAIHVGENLPFWLEEQRTANAELSGVVQQLGVEIQAHLHLIQTWEKGASRNSEVAEKTLTVLTKLMEKLPSTQNQLQESDNMFRTSASKSRSLHNSTASDTKYGDYEN
jgi:hypothetical protein